MEHFNKMREDLKQKGADDISLMVVNAGIGNGGNLADISCGQALAVAKVNMYHPTAILKAFLP